MNGVIELRGDDWSGAAVAASVVQRREASKHPVGGGGVKD